MIPMACRMLNPPNVFSEIPSSVFLRQTAITWGTKSRALHSNPSPKITATSLLHCCFSFPRRAQWDSRRVLTPRPPPTTDDSPTGKVILTKSEPFLH